MMVGVSDSDQKANSGPEDRKRLAATSSISVDIRKIFFTTLGSWFQVPFQFKRHLQVYQRVHFIYASYLHINNAF